MISDLQEKAFLNSKMINLQKVYDNESVSSTKISLKIFLRNCSIQSVHQTAFNNLGSTIKILI